MCATGNDLKLLETILCKLGLICATGNALMLLEKVLCNFGRICARVSALIMLQVKFMWIWTDLSDSKCSYAAKMVFWKFLPKFEEECAEPFYVVMTHYTAKAICQTQWLPSSKLMPYMPQYQTVITIEEYQSSGLRYESSSFHCLSIGT